MRTRPLLTAILLATAFAALTIRVLSVVEPLGIDQSLWASAVRGLSRHQLLYRDVWEQRPPGIYLTYLAAFTLFGWTPAAVAWLDILASTASSVLLFSIGRRLSDATTGALATALYATLTIPGWLYRHDGFLERSVCETFIVVCVALSAWCAIECRERSSSSWAAGIGLFAGMVLSSNRMPACISPHSCSGSGSIALVLRMRPGHRQCGACWSPCSRQPSRRH